MLTIGDAREWAGTLAPLSVQCIVTSPPYFGLRSYLHAEHPDKAREMGSEATPDEFVAQLVALFAALRPALRDDGTLWLNLGDSYAGGGNGSRDAERWPKQSRNAHGFRNMHAKKNLGGDVKDKDLIGIPWMVAFALRADGWYLRSDIIWHKPNPMPESVKDRPTRSHEYLFLLSKGPRYYYDAEAVMEEASPNTHARRSDGCPTPKMIASAEANYGGWQKSLGPYQDTGTRNKRDVWTIPTAPYPDAHFATFPPELIRPCILAGSRRGDVVADPFMGSGTVAQVATEEGRRWVGCDLDARAVEWTRARLDGRQIRLGLTA